jgi:D-serine deaminase-like pyridoxal phosphate-dependent protein
MTSLAGQPLDALDSPQLLLDLDAVDANLALLQAACRERQVDLRIHFKSLKCGNLARYLAEAGTSRFLSAKLNEAEVLADFGITDIFVANQIIGAAKLRRLAALARRATVRVCVDDAGNVAEMAAAGRQAGASLGVLVEVDTGMSRCGVEPGEAALELARRIVKEPGLRFDGLQGYDGHLQLIADLEDKRKRCLAGLERLVATRRLIEAAGIPVSVVTGGGTGTWEWVAGHPGITEVQPGSFLLMDAVYHTVRPEFRCSLSILATVISRRPRWYVLDAGSKAISQDFGAPLIKDHPAERVLRLAEEHAKVEDGGEGPRLGQRREVLPAHCCATMNLHRRCVAVRQGRVVAEWPIEASGRYD